MARDKSITESSSAVSSSIQQIAFQPADIDGLASARHSELALLPTTKRTVVTTTTTTTLHFAPLHIPPVAPPLLLDPSASSQCQNSTYPVRQLDPKLYPLAALNIPRIKQSLAIPISSQKHPSSSNSAHNTEERFISYTTKNERGSSDAPPTPQSHSKADSRRSGLHERGNRKRSIGAIGENNNSVPATLSSEGEGSLAKLPRKKSRPNPPGEKDFDYSLSTYPDSHVLASPQVCTNHLAMKALDVRSFIPHYQ